VSLTTKPKRARTAVARGRTRGLEVADRGKTWLEHQDPTSRKGATIGWVTRYREADGQLYAVLLTAYVFVTVLPVMVVEETYLYRDSGAFANHVIRRLGLTGQSATLLTDVISGASANKLGSALIAIVNVLFVGLGFGRVLQLAHARSWQIEPQKGMVTDQLRYLTSLLVLLGLLTLYLVQAKFLSGRPAWIGWALVPLWLAAIFGYFIWLPRLLLHKRVSVRDVLPGALVTMAALVGLRLISSFLLVRWLVWYAQYYGGFGVVMALFFWLLLAATILVVAAALSPAVAHRRNLRRLDVVPET
jgi:membrane protein